MGGNVIPSGPERARSPFAILCAIASLCAVQPAAAQPQAEHDPPPASEAVATPEGDGPTAADLAPASPGDRKITDNTVTAADVAVTPVDDFNLRTRKYPALLLELQNDPYARTGLDTCEAMTAAIVALDDILGEDLDIVAARKHRITAGAVGKEVMGMLIPFRGLIREASGANANRRKMADLIIIGMMRRAYLKGLGEQSGCSYPGRPADEETRAVIAALAPEPAPPAPTGSRKTKAGRKP